jgi:hypothetical protein
MAIDMRQPAIHPRQIDLWTGYAACRFNVGNLAASPPAHGELSVGRIRPDVDGPSTWSAAGDGNLRVSAIHPWRGHRLSLLYAQLIVRFR